MIDRLRKFAPLFLLIAGLLLLVCLIYFLATRESGKLTVAFMDIGQGDSIFIESPTGVQVLVDGGPDGSVVRQLGKQMSLFDRSIDALILTNPDQDHFAGFVDVLDRYNVRAVYESGTYKDSSSYKTLEQKVADEKAEHALLRRGQTVDLGGGAYLRILFPDRDVSGVDSNPGSLIMQLVYGETEVMLMGDSIISVENFISDLDGTGLQSDILKVGHHGSRTSTGEKLLENVKPAVAIISAGCDNSYGHPHRETLDRLASAKVPYLWTCKEGTVSFESNGKEWVRQ